jgi:hypothetical protein
MGGVAGGAGGGGGGFGGGVGELGGIGGLGAAENQHVVAGRSVTVYVNPAQPASESHCRLQ